MLGVGGLLPTPSPPCTKPFGAKSVPILSFQMCNIYLCASPFPSPISALSLRRNDHRLFAQRNKHRKGDTVALDARQGLKEEEDDDFDEEYDDDYEDEDEDEDIEGDDDFDVIVPFDELDDWLKKKPRGFGEDKVYDTSIEEGLIEEIEQSRRAQLVNINKLKGLSLDSKKQLNKDAEGVSSGVCVRISNLPRKKNIQRDLKTAFKGISGILDITPATLGNKKTKDPICKGLAFVNFKSSNDAKRFIDIFSVQSITFGKIDKQVKCELMNSTHNAMHKKPVSSNVRGEKKAGSVYKHLDEEYDSENSDDEDSDDEDDDFRESLKSTSASKLDDITEIEKRMLSLVDSLGTNQGDNPQAAVKVKSASRLDDIIQIEKRMMSSVDLVATKRRDNSQATVKVKSASKVDDIIRIEKRMTSSVDSPKKKRRDNLQAAVNVKSASKADNIIQNEKRISSVDSLEKNRGDNSQAAVKVKSASKGDDVIQIEKRMISSVDSLEKKRGDNPQAAVKGKSTRKKNTVAKLPGAARRLKLREKAMLEDVFSKYASRTASSTKES